MDLVSDDGLRAEDRRTIDRICDRFERQLQEGARPQIEDYLVDVESPLRPHLFRQLLLVELEMRYGAGEHPSVEEYRRRFPELISVVGRAFVQGSAHAARKADSHDTDKTTEAHTQAVVAPAADCKSGDLLVGRHIHNHRLEERLGKGGMGWVYRATHTLLGCQRAVKIIMPSIATNEQIVRRFREEAKAISMLSHQNIVRLHDFGEDGGILYLVMEYLEGEDLGKRVERLGPLDVSEALELMRQAAAGVAYAHGQRRVHRDLKPRNLFRTTDGTCKVLDFGLVKALQETGGTWVATTRSSLDLNVSDQLMLTEGHSRLGTPGYMSPEQLEDPRVVNERSDIYSLGCTLYFLVAGKHAFSGRPEEIREATRAGNFAAPRSIRSDVSVLLNDFILKMMHRNPEERPETAGQVVHRLGQLKRWDASLDKGTGQTESQVRWAQRFFLPIVILIALLPTLLLIYPNSEFNWKIVSDEAAEKFKLVRIIINGVGIVAGLIGGSVVSWPVARTLQRILKGEPVTESDVRAARHRCLRLGMYAMWINLFGWMAAGPSYPALLHFLGMDLTWPSVVQFVLSLTLYGLVAAIYAYFLVSFVSLRVAYPLLLDRALPTDDEPDQIQRESRRSGLLENAAMVAPMLCILTIVCVRSASGEDQAVASSVFALVAVGLVAYPFAVYAARFMRRQLGNIYFVMTGERSGVV